MDGNDNTVVNTLTDNIGDCIESLFGVHPKHEQVKTLETLLYRRQDLILIARTGFGKSIVFQAAPLLYEPSKIALIIMPLKPLEDEQCFKVAAIVRAKPFVLKGETNNPQNLRDIRDGKYTHS